MFAQPVLLPLKLLLVLHLIVSLFPREGDCYDHPALIVLQSDDAFICSVNICRADEEEPVPDFPRASLLLLQSMLAKLNFLLFKQSSCL